MSADKGKSVICSSPDTVDIERVEKEGDVVTFNVGDLKVNVGGFIWDNNPGEAVSSGLGLEYEGLVDAIQKIATRGGTVFQNISFTYVHDINLYAKKKEVKKDVSRKYLIVKLTGKNHGGVSVATDFLMQKENLYLVAYKKSSPGGKWLLVPAAGVDALTVSQGSAPAEFNGDYIDMSANMVGRNALLTALNSLVDDTVGNYTKKGAFQTICYHLAEAVRFKEIWKLATQGMTGTNETILGDDRDRMNNWKKHSNSIICLTHLDETIGASRTLTPTQLRNMIRCGLRENAGKKDLRWKNSTAGKRNWTYIDNIERAKKPIDDKNQKKSVHSDEVKMKALEARDGLVDKWKAIPEKDADVWTCIIRALSDPDPVIANLIVYHANLFVIKKDLSEVYSDKDVVYKIEGPDMENYMKTFI